ncbi:transcriptional regulator [uncultured Methanobrevibacter sp.]|uniref:transcriptional regulator n=1 Tax=uncultured Methanobrevibacter sp. TaxID=253161 RepID=UPI0026020871|nr:transcriptional regulator [uncultured Methanobrevibacter sp.]
MNISSYRVNTVKALQNEIKTPTDIASDAGIRVNHISKVLRELKETGVAECINEESRKGRLYRLTDVGEEIVDYLE